MFDSGLVFGNANDQTFLYKSLGDVPALSNHSSKSFDSQRGIAVSERLVIIMSSLILKQLPTYPNLKAQNKNLNSWDKIN